LTAGDKQTVITLTAAPPQDIPELDLGGLGSGAVLNRLQVCEQMLAPALPAPVDELWAGIPAEQREADGGWEPRADGSGDHNRGSSLAELPGCTPDEAVAGAGNPLGELIAADVARRMGAVFPAAAAAVQPPALGGPGDALDARLAERNLAVAERICAARRAWASAASQAITPTDCCARVALAGAARLRGRARQGEHCP
jgi:hypothetical protein